jgi:hypothetical protein
MLNSHERRGGANQRTGHRTGLCEDLGAENVMTTIEKPKLVAWLGEHKLHANAALLVARCLYLVSSLGFRHSLLRDASTCP